MNLRRAASRSSGPGSSATHTVRTFPAIRFNMNSFLGNIGEPISHPDDEEQVTGEIDDGGPDEGQAEGLGERAPEVCIDVNDLNSQADFD